MKDPGSDPSAFLAKILIDQVNLLVEVFGYCIPHCMCLMILTSCHLGSFQGDRKLEK